MKFIQIKIITYNIIILLLQVSSKKLPVDVLKQTWENTRASSAVKNLSEIPLTPKASRQMHNRAISSKSALPSPHAVKSVQEIPETPKAKFLHDHYGTYPFDEQYGFDIPNLKFTSPNALHTEPHMMSFATGESFNLDDYTLVSSNYKSYGSDKKSKVRKLLTNVDQPCVIELQPLYQICAAHKNCESCISSGGCGQCISTNTCVPGDNLAPKCRNQCFNRLNNWAYGDAPQTCPGGPISGLLKNVAPESKHRLIKPEIREHLGASIPQINEVKEDMFKPNSVRVISGDFSNLASSSRHIIIPEYRGTIKDSYVPNTWNPGTIVGDVLGGSIGNVAPDAKTLIKPIQPNVYQMQYIQPTHGSLKVNGNTNIPIQAFKEKLLRNYQNLKK